MGRMRIWKWVLVWAIVAAMGSGTAHAQITFERTYGDTGTNGAVSGQQTQDGGYIIAGWTGGYDDVFLLKTDAWGDTLWTRTYGGDHTDIGLSVQQTRDGGYIITGWTESFGPYPYRSQLYLIKTDSSGDTLWTRVYGGTYDYGVFVRQTSDGGYIITGEYDRSGPGQGDVWLVKTDSSGDTVWTKTYGGPASDRGHSVQQTEDEGYIIAGWSRWVNDTDIYLIKTDAWGDTLWTRTYGESHASEETFSVQQTLDGGYIVTGSTDLWWADLGDVFLLKTDAGGDSLWMRTYGGSGGDCGSSVQQTEDGGYIISGVWTPGDVCLIKTDSSGHTLWTRTYGGTYYNDGSSVQQTWDGGYMIAGSAHSYSVGEGDIYLIKTDSLGNIEAEGLVTGGGWIPGDQPGPGNKRTFGFNVHSEAGAVWGQLQFSDHGIKMRVDSDTMTTLNIYGDTLADFSGDCRVDGVSGYSFECEAMDRGEPGHGVDRFSIDIYDELGNPYYSAGDFLGGGNIQIHTRDNGTAKGRRHPRTEQPEGTPLTDDGFCRNSPNPFIDRTTLSFQLPSSGHTTLQIHDITGRLVATLVDGKLSAGLHTATWNAGDAPAGIYFYKLASGNLAATKKMVLLR